MNILPSLGNFGVMIQNIHSLKTLVGHCASIFVYALSRKYQNNLCPLFSMSVFYGSMMQTFLSLTWAINRLF